MSGERYFYLKVGDKCIVLFADVNRRFYGHKLNLHSTYQVARVY